MKTFFDGGVECSCSRLFITTLVDGTWHNIFPRRAVILPLLKLFEVTEATTFRLLDWLLDIDGVLIETSLPVYY